MKKYKDAKEWVNSEEVEKVLAKFAKDTDIIDIDKWVEWIGEEDNRKAKDVKAVLYDFVEDTIEDEGTLYPYPEDTYKKWMLYRAGELLTKDRKTGEIRLLKNVSEKFVEIRKYFDGKEHNEEKNFIMKLHDPDGEICGSKLLQDIYKTLWTNILEQKYMKHSDGKDAWICSDTMTSAQQKMNDFLHVIETENACCNTFQTIRKEIENTKYSQRLCIELYFRGDKNGTTFEGKIREIAGTKEGQLRRFLECWHMLGNYCPVPRHFNSARSGSYARHDYWDLTLIKIKEYYDKKEKPDNNKYDDWKELGEELLHGSGNALACKKWLDSFTGGWKDFIEKNYMQDFVEDFDNGNYEVKRFFKDHDWNKPTPDTSEKFEELFKNASEMIEKRTLRMIIALRKEITNGKTKTNQSRTI